MKRNLTLIAAALILVLSVSGCGKKNDTKNKEMPQATAQTDVSDSYSQPADISKVDGRAAQTASDKSDYSGKLGDYEITIGDAKLVDNNGSDAVIVSFTFKNKSNKDIAFTGAMDVKASQNGEDLLGTVVTNVEGANMTAIGERVPKGETVEVHQAYALRERALPIDVEVREFGSDGEEVLTKSFEF